MWRIHPVQHEFQILEQHQRPRSRDPQLRLPVRGLDERLAYDDQRLALNIALIRRLATEIEKTVVVRPHPEENIEVYRRTFADMPNVHAVYEDSAHYWILAAELMIHNHSTTGLEAAMLGHASLAYTPIPTEENFCPWIPIACSHRVEHEDEAVAFVANRDWQQPPPSLAGILHDFFSYDRDATPQVIDAISELAGRRLHEGASGSLTPLVWRRRLSYWKQQLLGREILSPLNRNKLQELKPSIVGERYKTIVGAMPAGNPTAFTALHPHLYRVTPAS
ncbi:hypothetical protein FNB15_02985 [Ferrovibrio terrae]|uniref:Uncharacterized protein n=1 Tax=Ferrovibrio terrae TaxID=2594003 RepID=A0A516GXQ4_9PROT|nr:hypothetical protein FNB15_02985 [Ferrovibrio terrae]